MNRWIRQRLSPSQYIVHEVETEIEIGKTSIQSWEILDLKSYGRTLLLDGAIQSTLADEACYHEALHLPVQMLRPNAKRVLLIGGANGGSLARVALLPELTHITLIDVDSALHKISVQYLAHAHGKTLNDPRVNFIFGQPDTEIAKLAADGEHYDLIIADTPDATQASYTARLFSVNCIKIIVKLLERNGLFVTQAGQAHPFSCRLTARINATLSAYFSRTVLYSNYVPSYGCPWFFAIAGENLDSLHLLSTKYINERLSQLGIKNMLKAYDGETHQHFFSIPRFLREGLAREIMTATPISLDDPEHVVVADSSSTI